MFKNRVLRRNVVSNRDEVTGEWRKPRNNEFNYLYSPNIIRVTKSTRISWAEMRHAWERGEVYTGFWWGNPRERNHLEDPGIDGRIILR
jgi:hypothetical protein